MKQVWQKLKLKKESRLFSSHLLNNEMHVIKVLTYYSKLNSN